ncbi:hypothetical protein MK292_00575 [Myxococcota bacterium]|nr:hypothetical protein [Myxococcota bacterium]
MIAKTLGRWQKPIGVLVVFQLAIFTLGCGRYGSPVRQQQTSSPSLAEPAITSPADSGVQRTINPDRDFDDGTPN